ncbi:flagellar biosynthesis anti-sigma factor FlgM [Serpentinicella alkaliphila]|uniref:Negative regulator of flagellin synthesis n=1 Tax=Serpentinicella alkaliphila TaxID=1734049 RepID=A0A4R2THQ0_9FIRM|nr:flagellar biosynthesis anti-sigma factor FlgM [Serpentinicella alkaliphila]QUH24929.1 flagellar biosynthesis anti-sigma factor FlgM [Serpentinicella alkaliphila]TCQ02731.1 FlgM family anti-sigma-28 factor [Serpentinicella alkaliphila]
MKIFNNPNVQKVMNIYNKSNSKSVEKTESTKLAKDRIEISEKAKEYQVALKAFKQLPEVREEKVKELREKIQSGNYQVSGKEIADKIIEGLIIDKKI